MSLTKRLLFDGDPAHDEARRRIREDLWQYVDQFKHRAPMRRKNKRSGGPRWDLSWGRSLERAVAALDIEVVRVNEGMFFRTAEERDAALARAEKEWRHTASR